MRFMKSLSLVLAAVTALSVLVPFSSAEAKPPGRRWQSMGVVGFPGNCYELWTRKHWLFGWQTVYEPVPCPEENGISGPGTGIFFADTNAFVSLSEKGAIQYSFGGSVPFALEPSDTYLGPVLNYGAEAASLVDMSADGEKLLSERIGSTVYPEQVWVLDSHDVGGFFTSSNQAALVTLSEDGSSIKKVHSVVTVDPILE